MPAPRAPDWTEDEFLTLLECAQGSDEEVAQQLPRRSVGAVGAVRAGIHQHHRDGGEDLLSAPMRQVLEQRQGTVVCPICGTTF